MMHDAVLVRNVRLGGSGAIPPGDPGAFGPRAGHRRAARASVSVRENERVTGIVAGSNPNHHEPTDRYDNYGEEDFRFGFNSAQTTLGGLAQLAGITLVRPR